MPSRSFSSLSDLVWLAIAAVGAACCFAVPPYLHPPAVPHPVLGLHVLPWFGFAEANLLVKQSLLSAFVMGLILGFIRPLWSIVLGLVAIMTPALLVLVDVQYDLQRDRTSHNLLGIEMMFCAFAVSPAIVGVFLGAVARRRMWPLPPDPSEPILTRPIERQAPPPLSVDARRSTAAPEATEPETAESWTPPAPTDADIDAWWNDRQRIGLYVGGPVVAVGVMVSLFGAKLTVLIAVGIPVVGLTLLLLHARQRRRASTRAGAQGPLGDVGLSSRNQSDTDANRTADPPR